MRRSASVLSPSLLLILAASSASASEQPELSTSPARPVLGDNTVADPGARLDRIDILDASSTWYRAPFDGLTWDIQLQHDNTTWFSASDTCLPLDRNPSLASPDLLDVHGVPLRVGPNHGGTAAATLASGTELPVPSSLTLVEGAHLLIRGSDLGDQPLTLTWQYADGDSAPVTVSVLSASTIDRDREASDGSWAAWGFDGLRSSGCGEGADLLWIANPRPEAQVLSLTLDSDPSLAGPLALSLATDRLSIEDTYEYQGTWSPQDALDAGQGALWYQVSWREELNDGAIELFVTCSHDDLHWEPETGPISSFLGDDPAGTYLPSVCGGRFVRYRVVLTAGFDETPILEDVTFYYDIDEDGDGFGLHGLAGEVDCDDTNPDIFPGAPDICGDGIDSNCDGIGGPDGDEDGDGLTWRQEQALGTSDCDPNDVRVSDRWSQMSPDFDNPNGSFGFTQHWFVGPGGIGMTQSLASANRLALIGQGRPATKRKRTSGGQELDGFAFSDFGTDCPTTVMGDDTILDITLDSDSDGIPDIFEMALSIDDTGDDDVLVCTPIDSDGDGADDHMDVDDDNDSVLTNVEIRIPDTSKPVSDWTVFDFVGAFDEALDLAEGPDYEAIILEVNAVKGSAPDADGDDTPDWLDIDDDGDGVLTILEANDSSGDGAANLEPKETYTNGLDDRWKVGGGGDGPAPDPDFDGDGLPNRLDPDDDGDGVPTLFEIGSSYDSETGLHFRDTTEGVPDYLNDDDDSDGVLTMFEIGSYEFSPSDTEADFLSAIPDTDGNDVPNYRDDDDDGDTIPTWLELGDEYDPEDDSGALLSFGDIEQYLDADDDRDGVPTRFELGDSADLTAETREDFLASLRDTDDDGDVDYLDEDDDDDGVKTINEIGSPDTSKTGLLGFYNTLQNTDKAAEAERGLSGLTHVPDYLDVDDDGDSLLTSFELGAGWDYEDQATAKDTSGNGTPDYLDPDDDADGIPTLVEVDGDPDAPTDGSGLPTTTGDDADYLSADDDGDGVLTKFELAGPVPSSISSRAELIAWASDSDTGLDTDGDGTPNFLDPDDDGDTIPTRLELGAGYVQADNTGAVASFGGIPQYLDPDDDNDGIPTRFELADGFDADALPDRATLLGTALNTSGSGAADFLDRDDDGDGVRTQFEFPTDPIPGHVSTRSELIAWVIGAGDKDTDGDDTPDWLDTDDDGDGVPTAFELGGGYVASTGTGARQTSSGIDDYLNNDDDGDGVFTKFEIGSYVSSPSDTESSFLSEIPDTDGDGTPDYRDDDDDGDTILTRLELGESYDKADNTGALESFGGIPQYLDDDDDRDGVPTRFELGPDVNLGASTRDIFLASARDTDGDDDVDYLDEDDDGDGVKTINEIGSPDTSKTGLLGFYNTLQNTDKAAETARGLVGLDRVPDYLDIDDDGDSLLTSFELGGGWSYSAQATAKDTSGNGTPDYLDPDDDADGIPTLIEVDGDPDAPTDGSGLPTTSGDDPDYLSEDDDGDGILTKYELGIDLSSYTFTTLEALRDDAKNTDSATESRFGKTPTPDYLDNDDDGDTIPTRLELGASYSKASHTGLVTSFGDVPDYLDNDDDNDGVPTRFELADGFDPSSFPTRGTLISAALNTSGVGSPDFINQDDDGDGILTKHELGGADASVTSRDDFIASAQNTDAVTEPIFGKDPLPDYLDDDDDGDTIPTHLETGGASSPSAAIRSYGDVPDFLDDDDDNDGVPTRFELGESLTLTSRATLLSTALNTDGDSNPNFLDDDDDGDNVPTLFELDGYDGDGATTRSAWESGAPNSDSAFTSAPGYSVAPDYLDRDDDGDGVLTRFELGDDPGLGSATSRAAFIAAARNTDGEGLPDFLDVDDDNDGVYTWFELDSSYNPDTDSPVLDTDSDGTPNYRDRDDDGDTIPTRLELGGSYDKETNEGALNSDAFFAFSDTIPDYLDDDDDNDLVPTRFEVVGADLEAPTRELLIDSAPNAGPGAVDFLNPDDDGDSVLTRFELGDSVNYSTTSLAVFRASLQNTDAKWEGSTKIPDYLDDDDDGDTIPTIDEEPDPDGDGDPADARVTTPPIPDYLNPDDDGDGVYTKFEVPRGDTDGDGIKDFLDPDDDGDNIFTQFELGSSYDKETDKGARNTDSSTESAFGKPTLVDYLDDDDDGDTILTRFELPSSFKAGDSGPFLDTDKDGVANHLDRDDDGDKVWTRYEVGPDYKPATHLGLLDTDSDGTHDYLDPDDDGDNVQTRFEVGSGYDSLKGTGAQNTDGDELVDYLDPDDDGDRVLTINELGTSYNPTTGSGAQNTDGDSKPDYLDRDDDGDGILTRIEVGDAYVTKSHSPINDTDSDGTPDYLDIDDDGDRVLTANELPSSYNPETHTPLFDTDKDSVPNHLDRDDDGDGILTKFEVGDSYSSSAHGPLRDTDSDGTPDYLDEDDDNDGVLTFYERGTSYSMESHTGLLNTGSSSPVDYRNPDDDEDNVPTIDELGSGYDSGSHTGQLDTDGDGTANYLDVDDDGDGFLTRDEAYDDRGRRLPGGDPQVNDFDGDGIPDYLDADDDNDGVDTVCENNLQAKMGVDYLDRFNHRNIDSDDDGIGDLQEWDYVAFIREEAYECDEPQDWDEDGTPDVLDIDDDGDGILTIVEGDRDDDQVPPVRNHCSEDNWEGKTCVDPSKDSDGNWLDHPDIFFERPDLGIVLPNYLDLDSDGDTRPDIEEGEGDDDNDGIPNYRDCDDCDGCDGDSDGDGIPNCIERDVLFSDPRNADTDGDGVGDQFEALKLSETEWEPFDTDGDGVFDINDPDDDGDSVLTRYEISVDGAPLPDRDPAFAKDTDADGVPDYLDTDDDGDFIPTIIEVGPDYIIEDPDCGPADHFCRLAQDSDCDGIPDFLDFDDNDGPCGDIDGDGLENDFELSIGSDPFNADTDGDGVPDGQEVDLTAEVPELIDTDGDGTPDILDDDDDGDGIPTRVEGAFDVDMDGVPNYLDLDSNGDGTLDEEYGAEADTDGDGIPDFLDLTDRTDIGVDCDDPDQWNTYDCPPREEAAPCACSSGANTPQGFGLAGLFFAGLMLLRRRRRS